MLPRHIVTHSLHSKPKARALHVKMDSGRLPQFRVCWQQGTGTWSQDAVVVPSAGRSHQDINFEQVIASVIFLLSHSCFVKTEANLKV